MKVNKTWLLLLVLGLTFSCIQAQKDPPKPNTTNLSPTDTVWAFETKPFFFDEFDYSGLPDSTKWGYDIGGSGWGNNELQYYTDQKDNASVKDGKLVITSLKQHKGENKYTSARLITKNKGDLKYGRVEVKAMLPAGVGTWPAIWMLPTDWAYGDWPKSGEIDIMEHVGFDPDVIHISTHCEQYYFWLKNEKTAVRKVNSVCTKYHVYRLDWTPMTIKGFIDDELVFSNRNEQTGSKAWPFDQRFHLLLNIAVGGNWGGQKGVDDKSFPARMYVDYVRFYRMIDKH